MTTCVCVRRPAFHRRAVVAMAVATTNHDQDKNNNNPFLSMFHQAKSFINQILTVAHNARVDLAQATIARLLIVALLHPLDASKTRVQTTSRTARAAIHAIPGSWYGGIPAALLGHLPYCALSFSLFMVLQNRLNKFMSSTSSRLRTVTAACIADGISAIWLAPAELVKVRVQTGMSTNSWNALMTGKLQNGVITQVLRDAPFRALYLILFDSITTNIQRKKDRQLTKKETVSVAAIVGATTAVVTTPIDVVRSRIMAQHPQSGKLYANFLHCVNRTVRQEGITSLYRGVLPRTVYMAASVTAFMVAYDHLKQIVEEKGLFKEEAKIARKSS